MYVITSVNVAEATRTRIYCRLSLSGMPCISYRKTTAGKLSMAQLRPIRLYYCALHLCVGAKQNAVIEPESGNERHRFYPRATRIHPMLERWTKRKIC